MPATICVLVVSRMLEPDSRRGTHGRRAACAIQIFLLATEEDRESPSLSGDIRDATARIAARITNKINQVTRTGTHLKNPQYRPLRPPTSWKKVGKTCCWYSGRSK